MGYLAWVEIEICPFLVKGLQLFASCNPHLSASCCLCIGAHKALCLLAQVIYSFIHSVHGVRVI